MAELDGTSFGCCGTCGSRNCGSCHDPGPPTILHYSRSQVTNPPKTQTHTTLFTVWEGACWAEGHVGVCQGVSWMCGFCGDACATSLLSPPQLWAMAVAGSCPSGAQTVRDFSSAQSADACGGNRLVRSVPADWPFGPLAVPLSRPPDREPVPLGRRAEHAWIADSVQTGRRVPLPAVQPGSPRGRGAGWPAYARGGYRGATRSRSPFITGRGSRPFYPA